MMRLHQRQGNKTERYNRETWVPKGLGIGEESLRGHDQESSEHHRHCGEL